MSGQFPAAAPKNMAEELMTYELLGRHRHYGISEGLGELLVQMGVGGVLIIRKTITIMTESEVHC